MRRSLLLVLLSLATPSFGQEEPPEGCFCLAESDRALPQIQRGCRREKFPNQFYWRAFCSYVDPATDQIVDGPEIIIDEDWAILPADHPDCVVCEPSPRQSHTVPRRDNDTEVTE